jgi:hypothetical protein
MHLRYSKRRPTHPTGQMAGATHALLVVDGAHSLSRMRDVGVAVDVAVERYSPMPTTTPWKRTRTPVSVSTTGIARVVPLHRTAADHPFRTGLHSLSKAMTQWTRTHRTTDAASLPADPRPVVVVQQLVLTTLSIHLGGASGSKQLPATLLGRTELLTGHDACCVVGTADAPSA